MHAPPRSSTTEAGSATRADSEKDPGLSRAEESVGYAQSALGGQAKDQVAD